MSKFTSKGLSAVTPYTPGEQPKERTYIKLNTNEFCYPPSPKVQEVINTLDASRLRLYPDPESSMLAKLLAEQYQVEQEQIFIGNGSDEVLAFSFMAFIDRGDPVYFPDITYGFYPVYAELFGARACPVPLKEDFTIDGRDYDHKDGVIIIANPNAPTGIHCSVGVIEKILQSNPRYPVIIDEAYVDFEGESSIGLLKKYDNLIVIQTFSKSRALAGLRVGYAIASREIIEDFKRVKYSFNSYNINAVSYLAGVAAMQDRGYYMQACQRIVRTRENTANALRDMGYQVLPSSTNFIFVRHAVLSGETVYSRLRKQGILVRHFAQARIGDFVRITIGTEEEMEQLLKELREWVE